MKKRVLVGLSGGVDSTLTAVTLQEEGYEVDGVYMKLFENDAFHEINIEKGKRVAQHLGIRYHVLDLSSDFKKHVYDPFVQSYKEGKTPNPCGMCNQHIKFGKLVEFADELGCEFVSTGHYINTDGKFLYQAKDDTKDQTYFLFHINPAVLKRAVFPMGGKIKSDVKELVNQIPALKELAYQRESSEICFVENTYKEVLNRHMDTNMPGTVLSTSGEEIGTHTGYMNYTIGQRKGFDTPKHRQRWFVTKIDAKNNQITVGELKDLETTTVRVKELNLFFSPESHVFKSHVKVRYRTAKVPCTVTIEEDGFATIELETPAMGVAAGQAAAFYDGDKLLGGGWIILDEH